MDLMRNSPAAHESHQASFKDRRYVQAPGITVAIVEARAKARLNNQPDPLSLTTDDPALD